jgi:lipopolysaccharide export system permease protein
VTTFDRYILREWLKILGLIMCATVGLLLIQAFYDDFRDLLDLGVRTDDILLYYATILPSYFSGVLTISLLFSLLFVLSKLHRNNEITAMRSAGLNIFATTRALWLACAMFCGVSYLLNAHLVPWSTEASRRLKESFEYREEARKTAPGGTLGLVTGVTFDNYRLGRMWYINRYSRYAQKAYGVTVSELDKDRRERSRLMASEAYFDPVAHAWVFSGGRELWFDVETGELTRSVVFTKKTVPHFNEDPALMLLIDRRPVDLSLFELRRIVGYFEIEANPKMLPYAVRYYSVLADTLGPLIILAIAIPFAVSGVRVSPTVGVSNSIGLFLVYYFLNTMTISLGSNGYMDPLWAAWLPNIALTGLATFFFGRMR